MSRLKVLIIDGAVRQESQTRILVKIVSKELMKKELDVSVLYQNDPLPLYDQNKTTINSPKIQNFLANYINADIIVLSSPEYHNGMSGALKNALDWLTEISNDKKSKFKLFGLMGGGGAFANSGALTQMTMSVRSIHGWIMPEVFLGVPNIWNAFNNDKTEFIEKTQEDRMISFINKLIYYGQFFRDSKNKLQAA